MHLDVHLIHINEPVCSCMQCDAVDVNALECILALHTCFVEPLLNSNEKAEKSGGNLPRIQRYASVCVSLLYAPVCIMPLYAHVCRVYAARRMQAVCSRMQHGKKRYALR